MIFDWLHMSNVLQLYPSGQKMAARPVYMMLFENMDDYYLARDFAFQESLDFMEGDVAGYSTLIFFAESGEIIAFCDNLGLEYTLYAPLF